MVENEKGPHNRLAVRAFGKQTYTFSYVECGTRGAAQPIQQVGRSFVYDAFRVPMRARDFRFYNIR